MRELTSVTYNSDQHTDENSLSRLKLSKPDIDSSLTYMWGMGEGNQFTFLSMTEGQGMIETTNDVQYTWNVMGKLRKHITVATAVTGTPGIANTPFIVYFEDNWSPKDYGLLAPDGETQVIVKEEPKKQASGKWKYILELKTVDPSAFCTLSLLQPGKVWILTAPNVPESGSRGNRSNKQGPGKMTNQISFKRYSKVIEGNIANKVVPIEFKTKGGGTTTRWINEEQRQFDITMRGLNNLDLYISEYNRTSNGEIPLRYYENDKPIPIGAGVRQSIRDIGNYSTYGYELTLAKLKNTISHLFFGKTDTGIMEIVVHGGLGFLEDFDEAIKSDAGSNSFFQALGDKTISGTNGKLKYGVYFNQYKHISGHIVTVKHDIMFDNGELAELDIRNGNIHPRTGYPMSSHTGVFLDYSKYDGKRNIVLKEQKGQGMISGVVKGVAPIPESWGSVPSNSFANDKDESSYEIKISRSINIKNAKFSFILQSKL